MRYFLRLQDMIEKGEDIIVVDLLYARLGVITSL